MLNDMKYKKWYEKEMCSCGHKVDDHFFCGHCKLCIRSSKLDDAMQYARCVMYHEDCDY